MNQETQQELYKYMSAERCYQVLESGKIRFSSPLLFNDPFDVLREFPSSLDNDEFYDCCKKLVLDYVQNDKDLTDFNGDFISLVEKAKLSKNEANLETDIDKIFKEYDFHNNVTFNASTKWKEIIQRLRLFCLSQNCKNTSLWYHYADQYKGAVISFNDLDDEYSLEPVIYKEELSGLKNKLWIDMLFKKEPADVMNTLILEKNKSWAYEEEKRAKRLIQDHDFDGRLYSDFPFEPEQINSVYLGPFIDSIEREKILSIIKWQYKHVKVYDSKMKNEMSFTPVL